MSSEKSRQKYGKNRACKSPPGKWGWHRFGASYLKCELIKLGGDAMATKGLKVFLASGCLAILLGAVFSSAIFYDAHAADAPKVIQWKFSSYEPPISMYLEAQKWWINEMEKRSGGRIKIKLYTLDQLCSAKEMCEAVQTGLADVVMACAPYFPGKTPLGTLEFVPFVPPRRIDHANHVWNELSNNPLFVKENARWNSVYGFYLALNSYNIMSRKPIRTIDDFKGLKIRVMGDQAALFKKLGAIPVSVTAPEIYTALERGLFDAVPGCGEWWFANWKVYDACKGGYYIEGLDINPAGVNFMVNKKSYDALPPDMKKIMEDLKWEISAIVHQYHDSKEVTEYFKNKFKAADIKFSTFPPAEREKMVAHGPAIWDDWKKRNKSAGSYEFFDAFMKEKDKVLKEYPNGIYKEKPLPAEVRKILEKL
jgi:TRAP-type C4-dicarboxylate transport system substrate-binding protein